MWVPTSLVTIIPDEVLTTAPFAIFLTAPGEDYENAPYLLRDWAITTDLAAALVTSPADKEDREIDILAMGRSAFGSERSTWNGPGLADLPNVHEEVRRVGSHGQTRVLKDGEATEVQFHRDAGQHLEDNFPLCWQFLLSSKGLHQTISNHCHNFYIPKYYLMCLVFPMCGIR